MYHEHAMRSLACLAALTLSGCQPAPRAVAPEAAAPPPASSAPARASTPVPSASAPSTPTPVAGAPGAHASDAPWTPDVRCEVGPCELSLEAKHLERAPGAPVTVLHLAASAHALRLLPNERVDMAIVVTRGAASVEGVRGTTRPIELGAWTALALGSGGVALRGDARVVLIAASVDGRPLRDVLPPGDRSSPARAAPVPGALSPVPIGALDDLAWGGGAYHARIVWGVDQRPRAAVSAIVFSRDAGVKEHAHDAEWECLSVQLGRGTLTLAGRPVPVEPGGIVCVPPGARHAWTPTGDAPLVAVQVYSPGGPEQRFKQLAGR